MKYISKIEQREVEYLQVLGKLYIKNMTIDELISKTKYLENSFGNRSKKATKGVDWKALSHAVRVILEFKELVETEFIKFPLQYAEQIKEVKYKSVEGNLEDILNYISKQIKEVEDLLYKSSLQNKPKRKELDKLLLNLYEI